MQSRRVAADTVTTLVDPYFNMVPQEWTRTYQTLRVERSSNASVGLLVDPRSKKYRCEKINSLHILPRIIG